MSVEMNVYTLINNAMAPALETEPFVEIDASMRKAGIKSIKKSQKYIKISKHISPHHAAFRK